MKFALIGAGKHGTRWARVLGDRLLAIVEPTSGITLEDVLTARNIDAVLIATPHKYHASITEKALRAGKHVFCEKPGGIHAQEIEKNIKLATEKKLSYQIAYNYPYFEGYRRARKLYEQGKIGDLLFIRAVHGFGGRPGYEKEWRMNKELGGGGHLHDQGVHLIHMVRSYMPMIDKVQGFRTDSYWGTGTEDNAFVILKNTAGVIASIHCSLTQWKRKHTFELYGTKGYLIIEGLGRRYGDGEKLIVGKRTKDPDITKERVIECNPDADKTLRLELNDFIKDINVKDKDYIGTWRACKTLRIVEEVYRKDRI